MSNQPSDDQGPWQQPPTGPEQPGPLPGPAGPPPPGGHPPGGAGGQPQGVPGESLVGPGGPPRPPPSGSKLPVILGIVVVLVGLGALLYVTSPDDETAGDDYCSLLEDNYQRFRDMITGSVAPGDVEDSVGIIHDIRNAAPEEIVDDWAQFDDPIINLEEVLDEEGVTWDELLSARSREDVPADVADAAERFAGELGGVDIEAMDQRINDHAGETCGLDLDEDSGG